MQACQTPIPTAETRQQIIDQRLRLAGWDVDDPSEAKKTSRDAEVGQEQARQYAEQLQRIHGGSTPLVMYTNGRDIYLVIADESHRSIYNIYQQVVRYFHALTLGLTATPRDHVDHDTFALFDCPTHDPTFAYSYQEAVEHAPPYLCDFEVLNVRTKFQVEGIKGPQLDEAAREQVAELPLGVNLVAKERELIEAVLGAEHTTYTALQIRFLQTLRTFMLQRGRVERRDLVESPFTQLHPKGIRGVFPPQGIEAILDFTQGLVA